MGNIGSILYGHGKRLIMRYNAEYRAHKFLEKGNLPRSPRHKQNDSKKAPPLSREALEEIHCKNEQLNEYLKKVYLTSTSKITGTPSKRPKPKKENEKFRKYLFYEPEQAAPGCCTLSNVVKILLSFNADPEKWSASQTSAQYNLNKSDVVHLVTYYSLFRRENFDFMNQKKREDSEVQITVTDQREKKSVKRIDSQ